MANNALSFDGVDDWVNNDATFADVVDTFTMEFWVNPTATRDSTGESNSGASGTGGQRYAIAPNHGDIFGGAGAGAGVSVGTNGISVFEHSGGYLPSLLVYDGNISGWNHVSIVYQDKTPSLYINGEFIKTGLTSNYIVHPSGIFGDYVGGIGSYGAFAGSLDEVRIWNVARTAQEIKANYNSSLTGNETGLVSYWNFDEGSGTVVNDLAGNNHGTLLNDPTWVVADIPTEPLNLTGTSGNDTLSGGSFNDTLSGLGGNDTLDGRGGIDSLVGGIGNDTYIVDNVGDIVTELAGQGTDKVEASVSYKLPDNVENLTLTGNENLTGKGNQLNNKLTGNTKNDRLFGYGGNDNLSGGTGNDTLMGGAGNDTLTGGTGNDYLSGGVGKDNITGGTGQDILSGGTGQDNFIFLNPNEGLDIITDFSPTDDTLQLKASGFGFNAVMIGVIPAAILVTGERAIDNNDVFIYDDSTGILSFDFDANGALAPVPLVMLDNIPAITNTDIVLF